MTEPNRYLVDSDVFIQAKEMFYRFEFCFGFWDWIRAAHEARLVFSIKKVKAELLRGNKDDPARKWALDMPDSFFLDDGEDPGVMAEYGGLIRWAWGMDQYNQAAKETFAQADVADAFLVAAAKHHGFVVASQEKVEPNAKRRIPLPNAAHAAGVRTVYVYDMLSEHAAPTFELKL